MSISPFSHANGPLPRGAPGMPAIRLEPHYGGHMLRCFGDRPPDLMALWQSVARRKPHAEALVCGPQRLSWARLDEQVMRVAQGLRAHGVRRGDRVALLLHNSVEFVVASYAILAAGAVVLPLSVREQTPGLAFILNDAGACALVVDAGLQALAPPPGQVPALRLRIVAGGAPGDGADHVDGVDGSDGGSRAGCSFASLAGHGRLAGPELVDEEDLALLVYTSGTTGFPKGAMLTHLGVVHTILHYAHALGLDENLRCALVVPLSHITGLAALMAVTLGLGGTLVVAPHFKAAEFLALAERERISYTLMVPAMYQLCLLQPERERHDLSAWTVGGYGGAPMPPEAIDRLAQWLPHLRLSNCYGATETTSPVAVMPAHLTRGHPDSVGLALPCAEVEVRDEGGQPLPAGETGELWLRGPMVAKGYWRNPQATRESFVDGYWRSGDVGRMDAQGFIYVLDRRKDMLNRGGYKIFSVEVENALCGHPDVLEAAVVARPCPVLGERVHAFVTARPGRVLDPAALRSFCALRLADYKLPESFTLRDEPLPRNANGKLLKRVLRAQLASAAP